MHLRPSNSYDRCTQTKTRANYKDGKPSSIFGSARPRLGEPKCFNHETSANHNKKHENANETLESSNTYAMERKWNSYKPWPEHSQVGVGLNMKLFNMKGKD